VSAGDQVPAGEAPHDDEAVARRHEELETVIRTAMDGFWIVDLVDGSCG
jgi:hypothetical protein